MDFRQILKPIYLEEDLVRKVDLFWLQNNYDPWITKMGHQIKQVSEKIINEYMDEGRLVNIDDYDQYHLKICKETSVFWTERVNGQLPNMWST